MNKDIYDRALKLLQEVFNHNDFKELQYQIIENVVLKKDTLAVLPTGGGKSICYQLPSLMQETVTLVISPLISLMQDQVDALAKHNIKGIVLNSAISTIKYQENIQKIKTEQVRLIYTSPEGLKSSLIDTFRESKIGVGLIAIDEAHCISQWGHDFRPSYLRLSKLKHFFPLASFLALTATATKAVQLDIIKQLKLNTPSVFVGSFDRPNLYLSVEKKNKDSVLQIMKFLMKHPHEAGIIYCLTRVQVDRLALMLKKHGFCVTSYHAGLSIEERESNQRLFIEDKVPIMIATVAFGMGINKLNIRFILHYNIAKSLEEYYQEIGRAGRDNLPSTALLLYGSSDVTQARLLFQNKKNKTQNERLLKTLINYANTTTCRRRFILKYFSEVYTPNDNKNCCCDNCNKGKVVLNDLTILSQKLMSCIVRVKERYGKKYVIDILTGKKSDEIVKMGHDKLSTFAIGKDTKSATWIKITEALIAEGLIEEYGQYNLLRLTASGWDILKNRKKIMLPIDTSIDTNTTSKKEVAKSSIEAFKQSNESMNISTLTIEEKLLYNKIESFRYKVAQEENVFPIAVFTNRTIYSLVKTCPKTLNELEKIEGIGSVKCAKIGSELLAILVKSN